MTREWEFFLADLLARKVVSDSANLEVIQQLSLKERVIYWGVDCTANSLHLGHLLQIIQIFRFLRVGFKVIFLLGGATSRIGDPSDKKEERLLQGDKELLKYQEKIKIQLSKLVFKKDIFLAYSFAPLEIFFVEEQSLLKKIYEILGLSLVNEGVEKWKKYFSLVFPTFSDEQVISLNNKEWLDKLNCVDFLNLVGRRISVNYLLAKDWVKKRLNNSGGKGVSYLSFSYSLFQAYDFFYLFSQYGCLGQLGGTDQWGNMTTGLKLINSLFGSKKCFILTFSLLVDKNNQKLSKSAKKETLFLNQEKARFFDFFSNLSDEKVVDYVLKFTFLSVEQVDELWKLNKPPKLRILQRLLLELLWFLNFGDLFELKKLWDKRTKSL